MRRDLTEITDIEDNPVSIEMLSPDMTVVALWPANNRRYEAIVERVHSPAPAVSELPVLSGPSMRKRREKEAPVVPFAKRKRGPHVDDSATSTQAAKSAKQKSAELKAAKAAKQTSRLKAANEAAKKFFQVRVPVPAPAQVPVPAPAQVPVPAPAQVPVRVPAQVPMRVPAQVPMRVPAQVPMRVPAQVPMRVPAQVSMPFPAEVPVPFPAEVPLPAPAHVPVCAPYPAQVPAILTEPSLPQTQPTCFTDLLNCGVCELKDRQIDTLQSAVNLWRETALRAQEENRLLKAQATKQAPTTQESHYKPLRGVQIPKCHYVILNASDRIPPGYQLLAERTRLAVPITWFAHVMGKIRLTSPSFKLKKIMDGFFGPLDLGNRTAAQFKVENAAILQPIEVFAGDVLGMPPVNFSDQLSKKICSLRKAFKNINKPPVDQPFHPDSRLTELI